MCFLRISHFFLAADDDAKWQPICQKIYDHTKWQAVVLPLLPDAPWIMQWNLFHFSHLRARAHENFLGVSRLSTDFCYCYKWGRNDSLIYENVAYFSYAPNTLGDFFFFMKRGTKLAPGTLTPRHSSSFSFLAWPIVPGRFCRLSFLPLISLRFANICIRGTFQTFFFGSFLLFCSYYYYYSLLPLSFPRFSIFLFSAFFVVV